MNNDPRNILPYDRVECFDSRLYIDDIKTPLSTTVRKGTVIRRYGYVSEYMLKEHGVEASRYPDMVDIIFDYRPEQVSKGHFTTGVKTL